MAGSDQSANLGGMLSQIGQTLGTPMNISGLTDNMKNTFRPGIDPNDPTSLQNYAQWAGRVGNTEESLLYNKQAAALREEQKATNIKKAALGMQNQYQQALANKDLLLASKIKEAAGKFSQETGVDAMAGIAQVDARERAAAGEQRAQEAAGYAKQQRELAAADREYRGKWMSSANEDKETLRAEMVEKGLAGTVASLEAADRSLLTFQQAQQDRANSEVALSTSEIEAATLAINEMASSGPGGAKMSAGLSKRLEAIQSDGVLTNRMKRQKLNELVSTAYNYNVGQASSADALARRLANEKPKDTDLKSPSEWLTTAVKTQMENLKPGWLSEIKWWNATVDEKDVAKKIEDGGPDLVRRTAAYLTTYPELTINDAIALATSSAPSVAVDGGTGTGSNRVITLDKNGNPVSAGQ